MNKPKVWVIKEQMLRGDIGPIPMDYSKALGFGDLHFITTHDLPVYGRSSVQDQWKTDVVKFVHEYDEMADYIITTGQPMAILMVGWIMGRAGKVPRFLVWRREENRYRITGFDHEIPVPLNV
jgi:hypothetical protein